MKSYKYRIRPTAAPQHTPAGLSRTGSTEVLSGTVQGKTASDLEERMAKAFDKLKIGYEFRARISSLAMGERKLTKIVANLPGEIEIDHLLFSDQVVPVMIDGEISHFMTPYQRLEDEERTNSVNEFGKSLGWREVVRVPFTEIKTQDEADSVARRIINGVYFPTGVR